MGMNIGAKNYHDIDYQRDLARMDVVILGFYRGWQPDRYAPTATLAMQKVVKALKSRNPKILVGQYTMLSEARDDPRNAADQDAHAVGGHGPAAYRGALSLGLPGEQAADRVAEVQGPHEPADLLAVPHVATLELG